MKRIFSALILIVISTFALAQNSGQINGYWQLADSSGSPKIIIRIFPVQTNVYNASVIEYYPNRAGRCTACTDAYKDQPFRNMVIIRNVKQDGSGTFTGGQILDPETGKWSNVKITIANRGAALMINSYGWFSWFGSRDVWTRRM